jgi:hypothetical protein
LLIFWPFDGLDNFIMDVTCTTPLDYPLLYNSLLPPSTFRIGNERINELFPHYISVINIKLSAI